MKVSSVIRRVSQVRVWLGLFPTKKNRVFQSAFQAGHSEKISKPSEIKLTSCF